MVAPDGTAVGGGEAAEAPPPVAIPGEYGVAAAATERTRAARHSHDGARLQGDHNPTWAQNYKGTLT